MKTKAKIAIAIHTYGYVQPKVYSNHVTIFASWAKTQNIVFMAIDGAKVTKARNTLVDTAIEKNCTHILFIDSDHIIDENLLPQLLGNEDASAVSGLVVKRDGSNAQVGFIKADEHYYHQVELPIDGLSYKVDVCAFGCTLINLDVFKDIEKPFFKDMTIRDNDGKLYSLRSDIQFCRELIKNNKIIRIDTRVLVGHLGNGVVHYPKIYEFQLNTYLTAVAEITKNNYSSVLDLGCGYGDKLIKHIKPIVKRVVGVDKSIIIEKCVRYNCDIDWKSFDLNHNVYVADNKFDLIICADVMEHLNNFNNIIASIKLNLKENGVAIISTPDVDSISDDIKENDEHVNFWNKEQFIEVIINSGLSVVDVQIYDEVTNYKSIVLTCKL